MREARLLAIAVASFLNAATAAADLIDDPIVLSFCRELTRRMVADRSREHGAFVVRTAEGMLYFVAWPPSGEREVLRWHGRFPEGTVAILHTHPTWQPAASQLDIQAARKARTSIYVITPLTISKTSGGPSQIVRRDWAARSATDRASAR
jgi:proteasome lid subunit RPN8/RPN11